MNAQAGMMFSTPAGVLVPANTAAHMREVDRIAVESFGLGLLQMMENAGRNLAGAAMDMLEAAAGKVVVLAGAPRGRAAALIELCNRSASRVLSLDIPSGLDATTGRAPGLVIRPERTLALPKTGLAAIPGDLFLADIGIPPAVVARLSIHVAPLFGRNDRLQLITSPPR
jgi:hypothetical protein